MADPDHETALATVRATSVPIHDIGTAIYLSQDVFGWAAEWGYANPFAFYFGGRGGMLGDVGADVVVSALGWFEPGAVRAMYTEGAGVAGAKEAAARMAEAHAKWGEKHFGERDGHRRHRRRHRGDGRRPRGLGHPALRRVAGCRAGCDSAAGRAAQLMQILREWRGGLHLVATTAAGLSPLEAILSNEGEGQAKFFGWSAPFPDAAILRAQARRGGGDDRRALRGGLAQALDAGSYAAFEVRRHDATRRHAVACGPALPAVSRGGSKPRTG